MDITYHWKSVTCPHWNKNISLRGKYKYIDNFTKEVFIGSICPIIENSRLPLSAQDKDLKLMRCPSNGCNLLDQFEKVIII